MTANISGYTVHNMQQQQVAIWDGIKSIGREYCTCIRVTNFVQCLDLYCKYMTSYHSHIVLKSKDIARTISNSNRVSAICDSTYSDWCSHFIHTWYSSWWHCVPSNSPYHKVVTWRLPNNVEMNIVASGSLVGCFSLTPGSAQLNAC